MTAELLLPTCDNYYWRMSSDCLQLLPARGSEGLTAPAGNGRLFMLTAAPAYQAANKKTRIKAEMVSRRFIHSSLTFCHNYVLNRSSLPTADRWDVSSAHWRPARLGASPRGQQGGRCRSEGPPAAEGSNELPRTLSRRPPPGTPRTSRDTFLTAAPWRCAASDPQSRIPHREPRFITCYWNGGRCRMTLNVDKAPNNGLNV